MELKKNEIRGKIKERNTYLEGVELFFFFLQLSKITDQLGNQFKFWALMVILKVQSSCSFNLQIPNSRLI